MTTINKAKEKYQQVKYVIALATVVAGIYYYRKPEAIGCPSVDPTLPRMEGSLPILGNLLFPMDQIMEKFTAYMNEHPETKAHVGTFPFHRPYIFVTDPEVVEYATTKNFDNYIKGTLFSDKISDALGRGIFNSDGAHWYMQRKLGAKIFTAKKFKTMFETVFSDSISTFTGFLASKQGQIVDLHDYLHRYFLDSFAKIAFGVYYIYKVELNSLTSEKPIPFATAFDYSQVVMFNRFTNPFFKITELFMPSIRRNIKVLRNFGLDVIQSRRESGQSKNDLLQLFMDYEDENGKLSDECLCDQVLNFIIAGRDTTSQALSWAFFCLSQHPDALHCLLAEIDEIMGDSQIPTYDQVREMRYAKAVFHETLRLYPSVPRENKMCVNDDILPNGVHIKSGWALMWDNGCMARLKTIWGPDAAEFKPERMLDKKYSQSKFTAFHGGPRVCLGKTLAELQGVFVMVSILKQFSFNVVDPSSVQKQQSLTLPMKNGLKCRMTLRSEQ